MADRIDSTDDALPLPGFRGGIPEEPAAFLVLRIVAGSGRRPATLDGEAGNVLSGGVDT